MKVCNELIVPKTFFDMQVSLAYFEASVTAKKILSSGKCRFIDRIFPILFRGVLALSHLDVPFELLLVALHRRRRVLGFERLLSFSDHRDGAREQVNL